MIEVLTTDEFDEWYNAKEGSIDGDRITKRILRLQYGNFGDHKSVGKGISELRFHSGMRIYYTFRGRAVVLLLVGGNKATQKEDIKRAKAIEEAL